MAFDFSGPFESILEPRLIWDRRSPVPTLPAKYQRCPCYSDSFHEIHPNGQYLYDAECQIDKQDVLQFKRSRSGLLESLEPQYKQIVAASLAMAAFIKEGKRTGGPFAPSEQQDPTSSAPRMLAIAWVLLDDYANAFESRDIPHDTRVNITQNQHSWCDHRRSKLSRLLCDTRPGRHPHHGLTLNFKNLETAVDSMNSRYLKIRKARKELYKWDGLEDIQCNIGADEPPPLCDEMVNWDCDEPEFGPKYADGSMNFFN
jgi:hypothetical protein